jgi:pyrroline-5-carboxylate reductase
MSRQIIAFVGGGNMAASLIGGLLAGGRSPAEIVVAEPRAERRADLSGRFGVDVRADNAEAVAGAAVAVLAVKPQVMRPVASALGPQLREQGTLVVSIAAGVREPDLRGWLGYEAPVVRTMPNTPALVRSGATALFANPFVSSGQRDLAESVMRAVGMTLWVQDEALMDVVTAVSGSGPAYFFLVMELLEDAGVKLGLERETARLLTLETAFGAARMALESSEDPATLRARVTSPGGTTERALATLEDAGVRAAFLAAVAAARARAAELGESLGANP